MNMIFELGNIYQTKGIDIARRMDKQFDKDVNAAFAKYCKADFSDMEYLEDVEMNRAAIANGNDRIFATYNTCLGKIYIITEYDRSATTILFPDEY